MKKINSIFLIAIASLFLAPAINAQTQTHTINDYIRQKYNNDTLTMRFPKDNGVIIDEELKVAYSKNVSSPFSDGVYYIKLETFATGQASTKMVDAPADIVLVLDLSSSMVNNYTHTRLAEPKSESYIPTHGAGNRWRYRDIDENSEIYEIHVEYEGAEYKVMKGQQRSGSWTYYFFYFDDSSGTRHYLDGDDIVDTYPKTITDANSTTFIYNKPLIRVRMVETRLEALQRATCAFIDVINKKDKFSDEEGTVERVDESGKPKRLGNRISIITFWSKANLIVPLNEGALADVADKDHTTAAALKSLVMGFVNGKGTRQDYGIEQANIQLSSISADRKKEASSTVVVFTDGEPYNIDDPAGDRQDITPLYNNAIRNALLAKSEDDPKTSDVEGYGATVFTVGLFSKEPETNSNLWKFMNYMSSNAPNASSLTTPGADFDQNADFYQDASGENADLEDVFTAIAKQSASGTTTLSAATSTVDVVSNSFILPPGVDATTIKNNVIIFTAPLNSVTKDGNGKITSYNFGTEIQQPYNDYQYDADGNPVSSGGTDIDAAINVALGGKDSIKVTNFDYSKNWCGPVVDETQTPPVTTYRGHKIIMLIPIKMNPNAVGGPNCDTNEPGSGIYVDDQALKEGNSFIEFASPNVSLPVNMYLEKKGLTGVESVKFKIERALLPVGYGDWTAEEKAAFDPSTLTGWEYVSSVFVTNSTNSKHNPDTNNPWVKVRGLPANTTYGGVQRDYIYRVSEEPWSWSYNVVLPEGAALEEDGIYYQYTDTKQNENPFLFENETVDARIDVKIRHAESKVTNHFSKAVKDTEVYDHSKTQPQATTTTNP